MEDQDKPNVSADSDIPTPPSGSEPPPPTPGAEVPPSAEAPPPGLSEVPPELPPELPPPPPSPALTPTQPPPMPNYNATPSAETNPWAIVSLVSSILSWVGLFGIGGIVGVICGVIARNQIRESSGRQGGDGLAIAGIVLGAVNIILSCIGILCVFAAFFGFLTIPFISNGR